MIVDMHAHYAMHLMDEHSTSLVRVGRAVWADSSMSARRKRRLFYMAILRWINQRLNYPSLKFGPGVTLKLMREGGVGIVLSPLYDPINEFGGLLSWILSVFGLALVAAFAWLVIAAWLVVALILLLEGDVASLASLEHVLVWALVALGAAIGSIAIVAIALAYLNSQAVYGRHREELPGSPPRPPYWDELLRQMSIVDEHLATCNVAVVARDYKAVESAMAKDRIAVIHSVEGGFQLGASTDTIEANVRTLAAKGVVYVTLAHLLWRRVATNAPAIPIFSDMQYRLLAPEPLEGLTDLGRTAVTAMAQHGILIDITHMSDEAIWETFDLLRQLEDCHHPVPVIATHMACRFGHHEYNLSDATIKEVARRRGVMGVIFCKHWMSDGLMHPKTPEGTLHVIKRHIDRIHGLTKSYDHIAIGSDLDGFIKPVLPGLEHMGRMGKLAEWLEKQYPDAAKAIMSGNVLRVLSEGWGRSLTSPEA